MNRNKKTGNMVQKKGSDKQPAVSCDKKESLCSENNENSVNLIACESGEGLGAAALCSGENKLSVAAAESSDARVEVKKEVAEIVFDDAVIDTEAVSAHFEEVEEIKQPKKKKKSIIWNLVFLAINIVFMAFVVKNLTKDASGASLGLVLETQGKKLLWLIGAVVCFFGVYFANALSLSVFLKNITGKRHFGLCLKVAVLGKYYEFITPMAVGGQPSQILNLINGGITPGVATSIPIIRMIINQLVRWVLIIVGFVFLVPQIPAESGLINMLVDLLKIVAVIGIIVTTFVSIGYVILGSSKIVGKKIAKFCIRIGVKVKLVKNYRKSYDKFIRQVIEYQSSMKYLAKNKVVLLQVILFSIVEYVCFCSIGFFTSMAFSQTISVATVGAALGVWIISIGRFQVVDMASAVMVLPGGTGIKEIAFLIMYNAFFQNTGTVAWSFLSWRSFDYYLFLLVGFVIIIAQIIRAAISAKNEKKLAKSLKDN